MREPTAESLEAYDSPLERLQLLGGDDEAIAAFLDELDVRGPRDREMLRELARTSPLSRPERFDADHRHVLVALESLRRHGHHGARAGAELGPLRMPIRYLVELVARYVVVAHCKNVAMQLRNLYWLREMQSESGSKELELLRPARFDAQALVEITKGREIGVPTFVIGGLLIPAGLSLWRLASGTVREWWIALLVGPAWSRAREPAHPALADAGARRALAQRRPLRKPAEGALPALRDRGDHADARRLDRAAAAGDAVARELGGLCEIRGVGRVVPSDLQSERERGRHDPHDRGCGGRPLRVHRPTALGAEETQPDVPERQGSRQPRPRGRSRNATVRDDVDVLLGSGGGL
jgi:hypothetical protein